MIIKITPDEFLSAYDRLRNDGGQVYANDMSVVTSLSAIFAGGDFQCLAHGDSIFLLRKRWDYFELFFFGPGQEQAFSDLFSFAEEYGGEFTERLCMRFVFAGRDQLARLHEVLDGSAFSHVKTLVRFDITKTKRNIDDIIDELIASIPEEVNEASFALPEDCGKILELFKEEFDVMGDVMPTEDELLDQIRQKHVIVIKHKQNGDIVSALNFDLKNCIFSGYLNITKRKYRSYFPFYAIDVFLKEALKGQTIRRRYGWRDINNRHTMRDSKNKGHNQNNVFISTWSLSV